MVLLLRVFFLRQVHFEQAGGGRGTGRKRRRRGGHREAVFVFV